MRFGYVFPMNPPTSTVSLLAELPENLYNNLQAFIDTQPDWDQDRAIAVALSLFLVQNSTDRAATRVYLDGICDDAA
jgi:Protein of unknown function (DUF2811)